MARHPPKVLAGDALAQQGKPVLFVDKSPSELYRIVFQRKWAVDAETVLACPSRRTGATQQSVYEALMAGRFGKIVIGTVRVRWCRPQSYYSQDPWRGTWEFDGGVLTNQASHHVDMLEWMMGDVESVYAMSRTALVAIEAEDTAVVVLRFASGALGVIEATTATRPKDLEGSLSILGESAPLRLPTTGFN